MTGLLVGYITPRLVIEVRYRLFVVLLITTTLRLPIPENYSNPKGYLGATHTD